MLRIGALGLFTVRALVLLTGAVAALGEREPTTRPDAEAGRRRLGPPGYSGLRGGRRPERLTGDGVGNIVQGLGRDGADSLGGGVGDDVVYGGAGDDTISGGSGDAGSRAGRA